MLIALIALISLLSCSSSQYDLLPSKYLRGAFKTQIMTFHPDHKYFLTNTDDSGLVKYDLRTNELRSTLDHLHFICEIGKKRYFICQDSVGLCRKTNICIKRKRALFKSGRKCLKYKLEKIDIEHHDFLVKSGVHCYSEFVYPKGIYY